MPQFLVPVIASVGAAVGGLSGAFLIMNASLVASGLTLLGGLALSSSAQKSAKRKAREQYNAAQVDRIANISSTVAPRELVLGRVRKGGSVFYRASTGSNKSTFVMLVALAGHEIDAVEQIYLNDQAVTLDGSGNVQEAPYLITSSLTATVVANGSGIATLAHTPIAGSVYAYTGTQSGPDGDVVNVNAAVSGLTVTTSPGATVVYQYANNGSYANIRAVLGADDQAADAALMALLPDAWTAAHRARGVAYLVCTFQYSETAFPNGLPVVSAVIRGAKVYDPRENMLRYSRQFDHATWGKYNCSLTAANAVANWDGTITADHFTSSGDGLLEQLVTALPSTTYTFSVWLSAPSSISANLICRTWDPSFSSYADTFFNCDVTTSMQRFTVSVTTRPGDTSIQVFIGGYGTFSAGEQLYIGEAQLVQGSTPKPNVTTTSTAILPTIAWSQNPALQLRHVYQHPQFGKATVSADEDDRIILAALACDTSTGYVVDGVTDTQALYRSALAVPFGAAPRDVMDDLAQAMAGSWAFAGGQLYLRAGVWTAPVMALADSDLAVVERTGASESQRPISISVHRERAQKFNTVNVTMWDQAQDYKQVTLTPLIGSALVTRDGATLAQALTYSAIGYAPQALHVAGVMMRDARDPLTVVLPFKLRAYPIEVFDNVTLTLSRYGWSAKPFMVMAREWTQDGRLQLTFKETAESIYTLDAEFSPQGGAANTGLPSPWYVPPVGTLTISSGTAELVRQADGTVKSRMRVSWPTIDDASITQAGSVEIQYREAISTGEWASVQVSGNETQALITDVQDAVYYLVRARARNSLAVGDWGTQVQHQVIGKTEAPPPFDTFVVLAQPDGTRQYQFGYASEASKPIDWRGAEIRYLGGAHASPDWDSMTPLVDAATFFTASPVELNQPLSGEWTIACKSVDTSGNKSTYLLQTITLQARRLGDVFDEYFEHLEGWAGTLTGCQLQDGILQAIDTTTWATTPATWAAWTRWNYAPTTPVYYETPARDLGAVLVGAVSSTIDADGSVTQELATSADGVTWSAWGSAAAQFNSRWIKLRITVAATGPAPVPVVRSWSYQITAPIRSEYINDMDISTLTGSYRIGTGDIRIPLVGSFTTLKRTAVTIQDASAGTWVATRIDQTMTYGPRWQFRLNGTLTDPDFVDFFVEGY